MEPILILMISAVRSPILMPSRSRRCIGDGLVHAVAGQAQRRGGDDAAERDDGQHFRGAAADIHDHRARRLGDGQVGAHGRGHGLLDEVCLTSAGLNAAAFEHRALLTEVAPHGMQMTMRGLACQGYLRGAALLMNAEIMASVTS